jgi:NADH-quinone oxidoreductase subunit D
MNAPAMRNFTINFGPQHPAGRTGVLRLVLELRRRGGRARRSAHRAACIAAPRKLIEQKTYCRRSRISTGSTTSAPIEPGACVLPRGWKSCSARKCRRRAQLIRVLYCEIGRLLSHILNVTTQAMDVGALTPPLWGFEEREKLMVFYERRLGSRMHAAYFRVGGVHRTCRPS